MATFKSRKGIESMWITKSTDGKVLAHPEGWRVDVADWPAWMAAHPDDVIITWFGINDQYYRVRRNGEAINVTPPEQGKPWYPQIPSTDLDSLPDWAIQALRDVGEVA